MNKKNISRRDFLKLATDGLLSLAGLLGIAGVIRFLSYKTEPPQPTEYDLGLAEAYIPGSNTVFPEIPAVLIHGEAGFTALSLVCTHLGCTVGMETYGFTCPCHGSQYSLTGVVTKGPATTPLKSLRVEQKPDGHLIIHMK
jgi:cytochrome b6-f complex iron-sulfur subunit